MDDENDAIKQLKKDNACLARVVTLMCKRTTEFCGNLSPRTSYRLDITGPLGKKEILLLIKRLQLEAKALGETTINDDTNQSVQKLVADAVRPTQ